MIRFNIIGFKKNDPDPPRWGDCTIIDDGANHLVIDGYCQIGTTRLISRLKKLGVKNPVLFISHAHYDHYYGIRKIINDSYFAPKALYMYDPDSLVTSASSIRSEIRTMKAIRDEAQKRGIPVKYLKNGDHLEFGEIKFNVYRDQPSYHGNSDAYINDGSLCFWFPDLLYLTTGDAGMWCANRYNLHPIMVKGGHHGNDMSGDGLKPSQMCPWLKRHGCRYYWDNDISGNYTDFLMTGREDAINAGMKYFNCIGDLNIVACTGNMHIYKNMQVWSYPCNYKGANPLKGADPDIVTAIMKGNAGSNNDRMTYLLDRSYNPLSVQNKVNQVVNTAKGIKDGSLDWGKNEERYAKINAELGEGYAPIVQKQINVLYGITKW